MATFLLQDFVQLRQEDPNRFTAEDLHAHLTLARLGKDIIEKEQFSNQPILIFVQPNKSTWHEAI